MRLRILLALLTIIGFIGYPLVYAAYLFDKLRGKA